MKKTFLVLSIVLVTFLFFLSTGHAARAVSISYTYVSSTRDIYNSGGAAVNGVTGVPVSGNQAVNESIDSVASDGSGGWYIGGDFTQVGSYARDHLAHIFSDGSVDPDWNPGADQAVDALVASGSTLYVGGYFTALGGQPRNHLGALDAATGNIIMGWDPNADNYVYALAVDGSTVYAGGRFTSVGGTSGGMVALDAATGNVKNSWTYSPGGYIFSLAATSSIIYVGGTFTTFNGQSRARIARILSDGSVDPDWNPGSASEVDALTIGDGTLYVGNYDASVAFNAITGEQTGWDPLANCTGGGNSIKALAISGSTVYAGGLFEDNSGLQSQNVIALDAVTGACVTWGPKTNGNVKALATGGENVYVGGDFNSLVDDNPNLTAPINPQLVIAYDNEPDPGLGNIEIYDYSNDSLVETIPAASDQVITSPYPLVVITPSQLGGSTKYYVLVDGNAFFDDNTEANADGITDKNEFTFTTIEASDLSTLTDDIATAQGLLDDATVGTDPGDYPQSAVDALQAEVDTANGFDYTYSQAAVDAEDAVLLSAIDDFNNSVVADLSTLTDDIATAKSWHDHAVAGTAPGRYPAQAITDLENSIITASSFTSSDQQSDVNSADSDLNDAVTVFLDSVNVASPSANFAAPAAIDSYYYPTAIVAADFNNDGYADFASIDFGSASIFLNNKDSTFSSSGNFDVGRIPSGVVAADFDQDGKIDLLTANSDDRNLTFLKGNGDGTFGDPTIITVGSGSVTPSAIATGYFNADAYPDLAVTDSLNGKLYILINQGDGTGTFTETDYDLDGSNPTDIVVADFNNDGHPDLGIVNKDSNNFSIMLGAGDGTFSDDSDESDFDTNGTGPRGIFAYDFNGDGKIDLAIANTGENNVSIYDNDGSGNFTWSADYAVGTDPEAITGADFDGDGTLDLAIANHTSNNISVLLGNSNGTFQAARNYAAGVSPTGIATADFNHDGYPDLVETNFSDSNEVEVFFNLGEAPAPADLSTLTTDLGIAQNLIINSVVGNAVGQFTAPAVADLQAAFDTADAITESDSQATVDAADAALNLAITNFENSANPVAIHDITSCQDLQDIDAEINADSSAAYDDYEITVPIIDCAGINGGNGFYPISYAFYGTLNGNGAKIINFNVTHGNDTTTGLFEDLESGAILKNLTLSGDLFSAPTGSYIGVLAGFAEGNITIQNVTSTISNLDGTGNVEVGGLIGEYEDSASGPGLTLSNAHVSSTIIANSVLVPDAGGLVGILNTGGGGEQSISDSSFSGSISAFGGLTAAGLIGFLEADGADDISISSSSASGDILGGSNYGYSLIGYGFSGTGGLIGHFYFTGDPTLTISNCHYSDGQITDGDSGSSNDSVGGLLGIFDNESSAYTQANIISQSYSTGNIFSYGASNSVGGLVGQVINAGNCSGNCTGSFNISQSSAGGNVTDDPSDLGGLVGGLVGAIANDGTIENFSVASTSVSGSVSGDGQVGGLFGIAYGDIDIRDVTSTITSLQGDADSSEIGGLIGQYYDDNSGNGLNIDDVYVSSTISGAESDNNPNVGGMIGGFISDGGARHSVTGSNVSGKILSNGDSTGGVIGFAGISSDEVISLGNNNISSTISGGDDTGGLIGYFYSDGNPILTITKSNFVGSEIDGGTYVGGLLGIFENASSAYSQIDVIGQSYSTAKINATGNGVGGLFGIMEDDEQCVAGCSGGLVVSESYHQGDVSGDDGSVGGLVGVMIDGNFSLKNSYASGNVSGSDTVGGLVGAMEMYAPIMSIDRSYAYGAISAVTDDAGGLVGDLESGNMTNSFSTSDVSGGGSNIGGLVGIVGNENYLINDYWHDSLDNGVGNGAEDTSAGHFVKVGSAASFQNNSSNPPLDQWNFSGPNPIWLTAVSAYPALNPDYLANTTVYNLNYSADANGSITGAAAQFVLSGTDGSSVTAMPNDGYHFVNWSDSSTDNPHTDINVTQDISVTANFAANSITQYTLTYSAGAHGTIMGSSPQTVNSGDTGAAVTAVPNSGYQFVVWSDSSTVNPRTDINVTSDISVTATFEIIPVQSGGGSGPISIPACSAVVYGNWGSCVNGIQYRNILSQSPASCPLTPAQQGARSMACGIAPITPIVTSTIPVPPVTPVIPSPPSTALQIIASEAGIISANNLQSLLIYLGVKADPAAERTSLKKYQTILSQDKKITAAEKIVINYFIVYGTPTTAHLGSGQRAGLINSYFQAYGKLPNSKAEWSDVIKIANGRWPSERSVSAENQAKIEFRKVYGRYPVLTNTHDQSAVIIIAYGLLPLQRHLASEAAAIKIFSLHYRHAPVNALAWNVVRAIAYSGATR